MSDGVFCVLGKSDRELSGICSRMQGASLRGRLPPPATLAHKEELNSMRMAESHREVHGFRCKLATCKCQELHRPRKHAACMGEIVRMERKSSVQATSIITSAINRPLCEWLYMVVGRADFIKSWKTSAVSTTVWMVETQLCKLRGTSDIYTNYRSPVFYVLLL